MTSYPAPSTTTVGLHTRPPLLPLLPSPMASHRLLIPTSAVLILGANRGSPCPTPLPLIQPPLPLTHVIAIVTSSPVMQMEAAWEWLRAIQRNYMVYIEFVQIYYDVASKEGDEVGTIEGGGDVEGEIKGYDGIGATRGIGEGKGKVAVVSMGIKVSTC